MAGYKRRVDSSPLGLGEPSKKKRKVIFQDVSVYFFNRRQGFTCVPSQGGNTLGMENDHFFVEVSSLDEHLSQKRSLEPDSRGESVEDGDVNVLLPVDSKERRLVLREAGVEEIDPGEKEECKQLRLSRQICGCSCVGSCVPDTCECARGGIMCQVDRPGFPCACAQDLCTNPAGRLEFNPVKVRTHFVKTIMRTRLEEAQYLQHPGYFNRNIGYLAQLYGTENSTLGWDQVWWSEKNESKPDDEEAITESSEDDSGNSDIEITNTEVATSKVLKTLIKDVCSVSNKPEQSVEKAHNSITVESEGNDFVSGEEIVDLLSQEVHQENISSELDKSELLDSQLPNCSSQVKLDEHLSNKARKFKIVKEENVKLVDYASAFINLRELEYSNENTKYTTKLKYFEKDDIAFIPQNNYENFKKNSEQNKESKSEDQKYIFDPPDLFGQYSSTVLDSQVAHNKEPRTHEDSGTEMPAKSLLKNEFLFFHHSEKPKTFDQHLRETEQFEKVSGETERFKQYFKECHGFRLGSKGLGKDSVEPKKINSDSGATEGGLKRTIDFVKDLQEPENFEINSEESKKMKKDLGESEGTESIYRASIFENNSENLGEFEHDSRSPSSCENSEDQYLEEKNSDLSVVIVPSLIGEA